MFLGRKKELSYLQRSYEQKGASLIVLYGRRRIGKTTLLKEFIQDKPSLYFLASEEFESLNMKRFSEGVADFTGQSYLRNTKFERWDDIFTVFTRHETEEKKVLVIDEFQYLTSVNKAFPSIFQRVWDEILKDQSIMVIICGSLIRMMKEQTLSYGSPLYGRRSGQINLQPLAFHEVQEWYDTCDFEKQLALYALTGGVPKYMESLPGQVDIFEEIETYVLDRNSYFYDEPLFLLAREINEPISYLSILRMIASGNHKIGKLASALEKKSSQVTPYLKTLGELGIVEKRVPVTEANPEKSRKALYFIRDPFIDFWFTFVYPHKQELEMGNVSYVTKAIRSHFVERHASYQYERVCRQQLQLDIEQGNVRSYSRIGGYWESEIEIDVMAIEESEKRLFAGECKYREGPVDAPLLWALEKKVLESKIHTESMSIQYALFSKSGFTPRMIEIAKTRVDILLYEGITRIL